MLEAYSQEALDELLAQVPARQGWDFSCMNVLREPVEYVVRDIESLLFWLRGLDGLHADLDGSAALASAAALNRVLARNVDERGFVTNEHRYLAVATSHGRQIR